MRQACAAHACGSTFHTTPVPFQNAAAICFPFGKYVPQPPMSAPGSGSATITVENAQVKNNSVSFNVQDTADSGPDGGTFEADSDATIENVQFTGNTTNITALNGDAGALGALVFLF